MFRLYFDIMNDAVNEFEISRILKKIAQEIENGKTSGKIIDINGNSIGKYFIQ